MKANDRAESGGSGFSAWVSGAMPKRIAPYACWHCDGSPEQKWRYMKGQVIGKDGKCLDLPNGSTKDGTPIQLWPCDGSEEQTWRIVDR